MASIVFIICVTIFIIMFNSIDHLIIIYKKRVKTQINQSIYHENIWIDLLLSFIIKLIYSLIFIVIGYILINNCFPMEHKLFITLLQTFTNFDLILGLIPLISLFIGFQIVFLNIANHIQL